MRMGLGLGLSRGRPGFRIAGLFQGGEVGEAWVNARENYFTKSSGGIYEPVTTTGDKIARFTGAINGINADQDIESSRPEWGEAGELSFALFDGVDDFLVTPTITPNTDKAQVFVGVKKESDASRGTLLELGTGNTPQSIIVDAPVGPTSANKYRFASWGTSFAPAGLFAEDLIAPNTSVLTGIGSIPDNVSLLRINAVERAASSDDQGSGDYQSNVLNIGARGGSENFFNGRVYSLIVRFGPVLPASTLEHTEKYMASRTPGVTI